jgi:hypothetical protein
MKFSYSFSIPSATPLPPVEKLYPFDYNEFTLSLTEDWRLIPTVEERTFNWYSEKEKAGITVSADFYEVPENKWAAFAEVNLNSRHKAFEGIADEALTVINRSIAPYSGGGGLELSYVAHDAKTTYLYLGYVTSRKIFNFTLTYGTDRMAAIALYNKTMQERLRVKIP